MIVEPDSALRQDEADLKLFIDQHGIEPWLTTNDRIEAALRMSGLKVLLVEKQWSAKGWRVVFIRNEPFYFHADAETADRVMGILLRNEIHIDRESMTLTKASFRLEAVFTWAIGERGRGVS